MMAPTKGDRASFLATVRERVAGGLPINHVRPLTADPSPAKIDYAVDTSDPVVAFTSALESLTGQVADATDRDAMVRDLVTRRQVRRAVVSNDPECAGLEELLRNLGVEIVPLGDLDACATADLGITGAVRGIALTGSIVIDSTRAGARSASLLPPVHLALLRRAAILPNAGELFRNLPEHLGRGLPSNLVLVTGPSKSADIELILTVGVHGPKELIVGLLNGETP